MPVFVVDLNDLAEIQLSLLKRFVAQSALHRTFTPFPWGFCLPAGSLTRKQHAYTQKQNSIVKHPLPEICTISAENATLVEFRPISQIRSGKKLDNDPMGNAHFHCIVLSHRALQKADHDTEANLFC